MRRLLWFSSLIIVFAAELSSAREIQIGSPGSPEFGALHLNGTRRVIGLDSTEDIQLADLSLHGSPSNLLYLDFDQEIPAALRDQAGRYQIHVADYIRSENARVGRGAALFNRIQNRIEVSSPEELWPGTGVVESFTIETWIRPTYFYRSNTVFRKLSFLDGRKQGLELLIEQRRLSLHLHNLFQDARNEHHSLTVESEDEIPLDSWTHVAIRYEAARGIVRLIINGRERAVELAGRGEWRAQFHPMDRSPMIIGGSFAGMVDEFRIASGADTELLTTRYDPVHIDYDQMRADQRVGSVVSEVIHATPDGHGARRARLRYSATRPLGTALEFRLRHSPRPFSRDTSSRDLPWQRVEDAQTTLPAFAYVQWRADLRSDPLGEKSPILRSVALDFEPVLAPTRPMNLREVADFTGPRQVCLEWTRSPDVNASTGGGYYIYYGFRPNEYLGRLEFREEDGRLEPINYDREAELPLTPDEKIRQDRHPAEMRQLLRNRMRLLLTNELIEANMVGLGGRYRLPFLEPNRTLYFAITSYNEAGAESSRSDPVTVILPGSD